MSERHEIVIAIRQSFKKDLRDQVIHMINSPEYEEISFEEIVQVVQDFADEMKRFSEDQDDSDERFKRMLVLEKAQPDLGWPDLPDLEYCLWADSKEQNHE